MKRLVISSGAILALIIFASSLPQPVQSGFGNLSDSGFENLSLTLSEEPGYFDTDNLISNELSSPHDLGALKRSAPTGEVYLGVGPDQNFSYMARLRPVGAVIVDLRRDNLLQHLYFKQLMEDSENRWEYLVHLFGRDNGAVSGSATHDDVVHLLARLRRIPRSREFFESNFQSFWESLRLRFPRLVLDSDRQTFHRIAEAFFSEGLELRFRSHGRRSRSHYPTLEQLLLERDDEGEIGSYLSSEAHFQFLRRMQLENRIIPVVGDFAGPKALSEIGDYLRSQGRVVSAFYVSNVEFYLFQDGRFSSFVENLAKLPIDEDSLVIRSYFNYRRRHPETRGGYYVTSLLQRIGDVLQLHSRNPFLSYWELVMTDYIPSKGRN